MGRKCGQFVKKFIFNLSLVIFSIFTIYLIFMGSFYWEGGNTAYLETGTLLRGLEMLAGTGALFGMSLLILKRICRFDKNRLLAFTAVCGALMVLLQFVFVAAAGTGLRYDSLKVVDEALALFSNQGIGENDLGGYFARYSNNYAMTIMTHWIIKLFRGIGVIRADFSNTVLVLQFVNVIFVDLAFAGAWAMLRKYAGVKPGAVFMLYTALNPLSYVWLPFYYTNTCSMAFAVWGAYLLLGAFTGKAPQDGKEAEKNAERQDGKESLFGANLRSAVWRCAAAGVLFAVGFEIRATVAIALIAAFITIFCFWQARRRRALFEAACCLLALVAALGITEGIYQKIEDHYMTFDESDTEFPLTHWIAMGLSDTGTFSPADEAYTMGFATKEEKKEATVSLIKERASGLGPAGVAKLYLQKLALTFGDGAGGYHSELNISRDYGLLWQVVYGVHRDPLLAVTQIFYLLSLFGGLGTAVLLWKGWLPKELFFLPLLLLGSYLFQMLWEAGTIYSIGTMYVNGCVTALFLSAVYPFALKRKSAVTPIVSVEVTASGTSVGGAVKTEMSRSRGDKRKIAAGVLAALCLAGLCLMIRGFFTTNYVEVSMSVDQFLFEANEYIAVSDGMEISQTFVTEKEFSTIALKVHNIEGEFNDSVYSVCLYDGEGNLIKEQLLQGSEAKDYVFYPLAFENAAGVKDYEIRIKKLSGANDLVFLYYDTGHYDVYPEGRLSGLTKGEMADLIFEVYWREEE